MRLSMEPDFADIRLRRGMRRILDVCAGVHGRQGTAGAATGIEHRKKRRRTAIRPGAVKFAIGLLSQLPRCSQLGGANENVIYRRSFALFAMLLGCACAQHASTPSTPARPTTSCASAWARASSRLVLQ